MLITITRNSQKGWCGLSAETKLTLDYEAIRRREYELITNLLEVLPRIDNLEESRVAQVRDALFHADHPFLMVFVGPFSSGKSSIINALMGQEDLLPVGPVPTTDRITILRYGDEPQRMNSGGDVDTVFYPSPLLQKVSFVDTPGLQSVLQRHESTTRNFLHRSDVVLLVMLATQAMTASNLEYMQTLKEFGKKVILMINQTDLLTPEESETVKNYVLEQSQLRLGFKPDLWMVSARRGLEARQTAPNNGSTGDGTHDATLTLAGSEVDQNLWRSSGLWQFEDYIDRQRQKLQTPLQIAQNVGSAALAAVRANQSALDMYQGISDNVEQQLSGFRREQEKTVRETNEEVRMKFTAAAERGGAAIRELFQFTQSFNTLRRGFMELVGAAGILRRMRGTSAIDEAFERHKTAEPLQELGNVVDKLGPRLEGRDVQDIEALVKYAHREIEALPPAIQTKVIGNLQAPIAYDRTALQQVRPELERIQDEALKVETHRIQQTLRNSMMYLAVWEILVVIGLIALIATWSQFPQGAPTPWILLAVLIGLALAGLGLMPLAGQMLHRSYAARLLKLQNQYVEALTKAADKQVDYGMRLRRESVAPLTRLIESQVTIQKEQLAKLQESQQEMVNIEQSLISLGKKNIFGK
jgi:GTP-binding protein EngB required for normal cell division